MPKTKYGFLDLRSTGKIQPWVKDAEKYLRKNWGDPCKSYNPECCNCRVWQAWGVLYALTDDYGKGLTITKIK